MISLGYNNTRSKRHKIFVPFHDVTGDFDCIKERKVSSSKMAWKHTGSLEIEVYSDEVKYNEGQNTTKFIG